MRALSVSQSVSRRGDVHLCTKLTTIPRELYL